jgi:hypothetical protein
MEKEDADQTGNVIASLDGMEPIAAHWKFLAIYHQPARPQAARHLRQAQAQAQAVLGKFLVPVNIVSCSFGLSFRLFSEWLTMANMQSHIHKHCCMQMCPCAQHLIHMNA